MQRTASRSIPVSLHWQPYTIAWTRRPIQPQPEVGGSDDYLRYADIEAHRTAAYGEPRETERVLGVTGILCVVLILGVWKLVELLSPLLAHAVRLVGA